MSQQDVVFSPQVGALHEEGGTIMIFSAGGYFIAIYVLVCIDSDSLFVSLVPCFSFM